MKACLSTAIFFLVFASLSATIPVTDESLHFVSGNEIEVLEDPEGKLSIQNVLSDRRFKKLDQPVPNFGQTRSVFWLKFEVSNLTDKNLYLEISNPLLNEIEVFTLSKEKVETKGIYGNHYPFDQRFLPINTILIDPSIQRGESKTLFLRLKSVEPVEAPIHIGTIENFYALHHKLNFLEGIYFGFIILIFLYNLFLYFSVKDDLYLYYVIYVASMIIMMAHFKGYTFEYLWTSSPEANKYFAVIYSFGCMNAIIFSVKFLKTRLYNPFLYKLSFVFGFFFALAMLISFFGYYFEANIIEMAVGISGCLYCFVLGISSYLNGNKTAKYYIVAFSSIIAGAILTTFYYLKIVPYNAFNANAVLVGSGIELLFLSLALADNINSYKAETARAQKLVIEQLKENEKLKDQMNQELEKMVKERTSELNEKSAQVDLLVYKASHDIKGPLRSIVSLTKLGMNDLKDNSAAMAYLQNIHSASSNVTNVVTELLNLAKIKETNLTYENLNPREMIHEILTSFQHLPEYHGIRFELSISKDFRMTSDKKALLSVLQNLIENGIKYSDPSKNNRFLKINISGGVRDYLLTFEDNGIGIPAGQKNKIFEMFYKLNEKSLGSGMGLYLVKETVKKLGGKIEIISEEGNGTTFTVSIPIPELVDTLALSKNTA